jgi:hypothetical protein
MKSNTLILLRDALSARGFQKDGFMPNGTMAFRDQYLAESSLGDLLDAMVTRREKLFRTAPAVPAIDAKNAYDDVELVISAIKEVIEKLS